MVVLVQVPSKCNAYIYFKKNLSDIMYFLYESIKIVFAVEIFLNLARNLPNVMNVSPLYSKLDSICYLTEPLLQVLYKKGLSQLATNQRENKHPPTQQF